MIVILDFIIAFPSVNHSILIHILESIGLKDLALKQFQSFLHERKQSVISI